MCELSGSNCWLMCFECPKYLIAYAEVQPIDGAFTTFDPDAGSKVVNFLVVFALKVEQLRHMRVCTAFHLDDDAVESEDDRCVISEHFIQMVHT